MTTTKKLIKAQRHIIDAINSDIDEAMHELLMQISTTIGERFPATA